MQSFKEYLITEVTAPSSLDKVDFLVRKYIKKKTGMVLFRYPGVEEFKNKDGKGFGLRYFFPKKNYSLRFNWMVAGTMGYGNLTSVTFWNGRESKPYKIQFKTAVSIVKTLPILIDIIKVGHIPGSSFHTFPDGIPLEESYIAEEVLTEAKFGMPEIYDGVVNMVVQPNFVKGKIYGLYKGAGMRIFDELERRYPSLISKQGTKYVWTGKEKDIAKLSKDRDSVLEAIGAVEASVSRGSDNESYKSDPKVDAMENDIERLSFEVQLKDLENLIKLTVSGTSNSLYVAGAGGCLSGDTKIMVKSA